MNVVCKFLALLALLLAPAFATAATPHGGEPAIAPPLPPAPPVVRLSDRSAQPIRLASLKVETRTAGQIARSTVELALRNPNARVLEGELQFPLLDGQQVTAFALDIDGKWRPAVAVEKTVGQQVFEDVTRNRVDPALLEATQGNNFKLRIYPLPPGGTRRVQIVISERLAIDKGRAHLRLAMPAAERLEQFSFAAQLAGVAPKQARVLAGLPAAAWRGGDGGAQIDFTRTDYRPQALLEIAFELPSKALLAVEEFDGSRYFYAELPQADVRGAEAFRPRNISLLWDASGSGAARQHGREFALLDAYFKTLGEAQVELALLRDQPEAGGSFAIRGGDWAALRAALERVVYDGATNAAALASQPPAAAVLLFSDGLFNYPDASPPAGAAPLFAISAAPSADLPRLSHLAEASGGSAVDLLSIAPERAAAQLLARQARLDGAQSNSAHDIVAERLSDGRVAVAGVLDAAAAEVDLYWKTPAGARQKQTVAIDPARAANGFAAQRWAAMRVAALEPEYTVNQAEIRRLGKRFSLVTRASSLIVLDRVEDYVRYDIEPPQELRAEFDRLRAQSRAAAARDRSAHLEQIVQRFKEKQAWWQRDFPKDSPPAPAVAKEKVEARAAGAVAPAAARPAPLAAAPSMAPSEVLSAPATARMALRDESKAQPAGNAAPPAARIELKKWQPDAPYAARMRNAAAGDTYRVYLDERPGYLNSTAFFLDAADILFERKEAPLALRVLSNLAEMNLENRHILRILAYRLNQAGRADLAVPVLEKVLRLAPDEPQSYRDLALAQAEIGEPRKAIDLLHEVVTRPWHGRFPDIELIALAELNAIAARAGDKVSLTNIDPRLIANLPLDLRVVLSWDADNTDIDLWVTDPNGEKVFYAHPASYQGGRISRDFTGGYGPEEFSLKLAKPGRYLIQANFYGNRQQVVSGATTLMANLYTGFGSAAEQRRAITLRLTSTGEVVSVGEIVVEPH
ncbi:MAG: DUF2135 domain-containing protein [Rhodocyclaceae bacterium]|nr:DUF2135 domain-containing protein [Rhodocyclaceae bacterium]MBX3667314.1 DUF2135 domain-containing protein [Rhodocyclaceae bacterium]